MSTPQDVTKPGEPENLPLNPDLMGYPTVEALVNAKRASDQEAKRIRDENEALKTQLQNVYQPVENPRQDVRQRGRPQDRLTEFGIPVDALDEYFGEKVQTAIQSAFQPIAAGISARTTLQARYPDYNKFEADVAQFIESDNELKQTYNRLFQADPAGAFEFAFLKFGDSRRRGQRAETPANEAAHAAIPSSRNGDARSQPQGDANVQALWERWQKTGSNQDAKAYAHARLHQVIPDSFLNA